MTAVLTSSGVFHIFHAARELQKRNLLENVLTGYPTSKLPAHARTVPHSSFWAIHSLRMLSLRRVRPSGFLGAHLEKLDLSSFDGWAKRQLEKSSAATVMAMSGSARASLTYAKAAGKVAICDRGSTHISHQSRVLESAYAALGRFESQPVSGWVHAAELEEYATADVITVPTQFVKNTFVAEGVEADKIAVVPYGVDVSSFGPDPGVVREPGRFLFAGTASFRKGVPWLLWAFSKLNLSAKQLVFAGAIDGDLRDWLTSQPANLTRDVIWLGHMPQPRLAIEMQRASALILPSVEEGLALVQAQAMACGLPVIGTEPSGLGELTSHKGAGLIVPPMGVDELVEAMQMLSDSQLQRSMSEASLIRSGKLGGWTSYGEKLASLILDAESALR